MFETILSQLGLDLIGTRPRSGSLSYSELKASLGCTRQCTRLSSVCLPLPLCPFCVALARSYTHTHGD